MTDFEWTKSQFYVPEGMIIWTAIHWVPCPKMPKIALVRR